jgi:glycosyltransferase involved in cell wall biosynthesis
MQTAMVSVVVPCYNQGSFLSEALQSVLAQTYTNWECIIVNDGSTDDTPEIINDWAARDSRFKPVNLKNGGVSNARNKGIAIARGYYILPLDGDDKISNNYIEKLVQAMRADQDLKVVYGSIIKFGVVNEKWELPDYSFKKIVTSNMIHCSGLYRKSDFDSLEGGYDVNMNEGIEDWEFWINFLKPGGQARRVDDAILYYRVKEESRMTHITLQKRYRLLAYIYHKHPELYERFTGDPSVEIRIDFAYSFYLSARKYTPNDKKRIEQLKRYYRLKLKSLLAPVGFFKKKKLLYHWYRRGKLNLSLWDVLLN